VLSKNEVFLILKTNYYQGAFSGMLSWEKDIKNNLGGIFFAPEAEVVATTSENLIKKYKDFEDVVYKNRDTRALRDSNRKINLIYSFLDKNTIIIATNPETLDQVITRLLTKKLVQ
jgi:nitrate/nitrite-specific signal transduction histidine kinase